MEKVKLYVTELQKMLKSDIAREHAYRPALHSLLDNIKHDPNISVLNDPKRSEHGAPDFVIMKTRELTLGHIETKDINVNLDKAETSEQLKRYYGYSNLVLTNYLEFRFFRNGEKAETITIGKLEFGGITFDEKNFDFLENTLKEFMAGKPEPIKSGLQLAKTMGGKARRIRDNVRHFLNTESDRNQELEKIYEIIKKLLIHDLSKESFADMYAQTLVYGLFIARYHDDSPETFTRQEARDLVPESNPFLKNFFEHIAGANFDKRLALIVNELCEVFSYSDVHGLMHKYTKQLGIFGDDKETPDPVIHFYEDFLKEYDPKQRLDLGVFYTPLPVVRFIVRSIDDLLKTEFGLEKGLADASKIERTVKVQAQKVKEKIHRVQVLDPATGTGTFLNEVINLIHSKFEGQEGRWKSYINDDLLPRIHGFELMIASYTIAHLKLGLNLQNSGYKDFEKRLGIYLTNSLEESPELEGTLFEQIGLSFAITKEAEAAGVIKNKKPIMVVLGNPPYSGESQNPHYKGNDVYKFEPDSTQKLQERNPKWLNDDYVKFIRFAESFVEKNHDGIVGMITSHGYLDNPTFRGMRWHLAKTFDKIYIIDLHGNSNKKETAPDGSKDENVFDIKTGVSIVLAVKNGGKKKLADVFVNDIFGLRRNKYVELNNSSIGSIKWKRLLLSAPNYDFVARDNGLKKKYDEGFSVAELFKKYSVGIVTARDRIAIDQDKEALSSRIRQVYESEHDQQSCKVKLGDNQFFNESDINPISYRPFDIRWVYYNNNFIERSRREIMTSLIGESNLAFVCVRQYKSGQHFYHSFISKNITDSTYISNRTSEINYVFPVKLADDNFGERSNLNDSIKKSIQSVAGEVSDVVIFDYLYAVLHSPSYREKYKEFLKIDFPRISYPKDKKQFEKLAERGKELRELHLMESSSLNNLTTTYPIEGTDKVEKMEFSSSRVYINGNQYFGNVPEIAWNFYIGGYQPAQKWLKDRKGRALSSNDIEHYQKIIIALSETDRIMKEIDNIL